MFLAACLCWLLLRLALDCLLFLLLQVDTIDRLRLSWDLLGRDRLDTWLMDLVSLEPTLSTGTSSLRVGLLREGRRENTTGDTSFTRSGSFGQR